MSPFFQVIWPSEELPLTKCGAIGALMVDPVAPITTMMMRTEVDRKIILALVITGIPELLKGALTVLRAPHFSYCLTGDAQAGEKALSIRKATFSID